MTDEFRVLHWNVHSWTDERGRGNVGVVADLLNRLRPDAVSLVEVDEPLAGPSPLANLVRSTGYHPVFVPSFGYGDDDGPTGEFGNAVLSRRPVLAVRHHQLKWPSSLYDGTEPSESRSVVLVSVPAGSTSIWVGSTHLSREQAGHRRAALDRVLALMTALSGPWLLLGDFNIGPSGCRQSRNDLSTYPEPAVASYPVEQPQECIDYCVAPMGSEVEATVLSTPGSDHLPVLATYRCPRPR